LLLCPTQAQSTDDDFSPVDVENFMHDPSELFHMGDTNFDHYITLNEFAALKISKDPQVIEIFKRNGGGAQALIDAMDADGDEKVSIDEFLAYEEPFYHKSLGLEDFQECDIDGSGSLSLEEYINSNYANSRNPQGDPQDPTAATGYEAHFKQLDTNANGQLEKDEFLKEAALDRFTQVDDNGDGLLSFEEYMHHDDNFYHADDPEEDNALMKTAFEDLDRNQDGFLSRAEDNMVYYSRDEEDPFDEAQHHMQGQAPLLGASDAL